MRFKKTGHYPTFYETFTKKGINFLLTSTFLHIIKYDYRMKKEVKKMSEKRIAKKAEKIILKKESLPMYFDLFSRGRI